MKIIARTPVQFERPFFVFNKITKDVIISPSVVEPNHIAAWAIDFNTEECVELDTLEELMVKFDSLGLVMPEADTWDCPERPLRLAIPNDDMTEIIKQVPSVVQKLELLKDFIIVRNRTQYIYLVEIYPDDQVLFANYIQNRP